MFQKRIQNTTLMWIVAGALVFIIVLAGGYLWLSSDASEEQVVQQPTTTPTPVPSEQEPAPTDANLEAASADPILVDETLLTNQIPENPTLAQEEIARLEDIQKQLIDQNETLNGQHQDADQLIQLKEEQIKILEQQVQAQKS